MSKGDPLAELLKLARSKPSRKHPKRHRTNVRRSQVARGKASRGKAKADANGREGFLRRQQVAAYWSGERDGFPD